MTTGPRWLTLRIFIGVYLGVLLAVLTLEVLHLAIGSALIAGAVKNWPPPPSSFPAPASSTGDASAANGASSTATDPFIALIPDYSDPRVMALNNKVQDLTTRYTRNEITVTKWAAEYEDLKIEAAALAATLQRERKAKRP